VEIISMKDDILQTLNVSGTGTPQDPKTTDAKAGAADLWDEE